MNTLFDPQVKTLCHKTDPPTSHEAAQKMVKSGKLSEQQDIVLITIRLYVTYRSDTFTAKELNHYSELGYYLIQRRLKELMLKGYIERLAVDGTVWFEGCSKPIMKREGCAVWRLKTNN